MAFNSVDSELQAAREEEEARREREELERMYALDEQRQQDRLGDADGGGSVAKQYAKNQARQYAKTAANKAIKSAAGKVAKRGLARVLVATAPYWGPVFLILIGIILLIFLVVMVPVAVCNSDGWDGTIARWSSTIGSKVGLTADICGLLTFGGGASGGAGASGSFEPGVGHRLGKYTDAEAREQLRLALIGVNAPRPQTSLENVNIASIDEVIRFKQECDAWTGMDGECDVMVTGGTEGGHAVGVCSHANGYKIDLRPTAKVNRFIELTYTQTANRADRSGSVPQFVSDRGSVYAREYQGVVGRDHWDILIGCGSVLNET